MIRKINKRWAYNIEFVETKKDEASTEGEGFEPSPLNCNHPCCYGRRRNYCWPCLKKLIDENTAKKRC